MWVKEFPTCGPIGTEREALEEILRACRWWAEGKNRDDVTIAYIAQIARRVLGDDFVLGEDSR